MIKRSSVNKKSHKLRSLGQLHLGIVTNRDWPYRADSYLRIKLGHPKLVYDMWSQVSKHPNKKSDIAAWTL